jgi:hypothetical protein
MLAARPTSRLAGIGFVVSIIVLSEASPAIAAALAWSPPFGEIAGIGLIVLAWSGLVIWLGRVMRDLRAGRMARSARPVSLTMDDGGITVAEAGGSASYPWPKVLDVTMRETHMTVALEDRPLLAVPLAVFASRAEAALFALAAEDHLARDRAREDVEGASAVGAAS